MSPSVPGFGSMKAKKLKSILIDRLGYRIIERTGSHDKMQNEAGNVITYAFHRSRELSPIEVRNVLVKSCGLSLKEAREVIK